MPHQSYRRCKPEISNQEAPLFNVRDASQRPALGATPFLLSTPFTFRTPKTQTASADENPASASATNSTVRWADPCSDRNDKNSRAKPPRLWASGGRDRRTGSLLPPARIHLCRWSYQPCP